MDTEKKHSIFSKVSETLLSILFTSLHPPSSCHVPSLNNSATILQILETWYLGLCLPHTTVLPLNTALPLVLSQANTALPPAETQDDPASDSMSNSRGSAGRASPLTGGFRVSMEHHLTASTGLLLTFRECHKGADLERSPWVRAFPC